MWRVICFSPTCGESFLPGTDTVQPAPVTLNLAHVGVFVFFCFRSDASPRFRQAWLRERATTPQMETEAIANCKRGQIVPGKTRIFARKRSRGSVVMPDYERTNSNQRPMVIVVTQVGTVGKGCCGRLSRRTVFSFAGIRPCESSMGSNSRKRRLAVENLLLQFLSGDRCRAAKGSPKKLVVHSRQCDRVSPEVDDGDGIVGIRPLGT